MNKEMMWGHGGQLNENIDLNVWQLMEKFFVQEIIEKGIKNKINFIIILLRSMVWLHMAYCSTVLVATSQEGYCRAGIDAKEGNQNNQRVGASFL